MNELKNILLIILFLTINNIFGQSVVNHHKKTEIVQAGIYLIQLDNIDVKNQTFRAEFYLNLRWKGPRSANNFELINAIEYSKHFYSEWNYAGDNFLSCKIRGSFRSNMDVTDFPFDSQSLEIRMGDYIWIADSLEYVISDTLCGYSKGVSSTEWSIKNYHVKVETIEELRNKFSTVVYALNVERNYGSFIIKVLIPILIVMGVSMLSLFIDKRELESVIGLGVTSLLSIIALYFSISSSLPDVSYATTIDKMMMGSYLVIFITMIETVIAHNYIKRNKIEPMNTMERYSKWLIPTSYILFIVVIFSGLDLLWFLK